MFALHIIRCLALLACTGLLLATDILSYCGEDATLLRDLRQRSKAVLEAQSLGSYRQVGMRDPAWDDDLERLLKCAIAYSCNIPHDLSAADGLQLAWRLTGKEVGCKDPLAYWAGFVLARETGAKRGVKNNWCNRAMKRWRADDTQLDGGIRHGALLLLELDLYCLSTWGSPEDEKRIKRGMGVAGNVGRSFVRAIKAMQPGDDPIVLIARAGHMTLRQPQWADAIYAMVDEALQEAQLGPGVADGLRACLAVDFAWAHRGGGWASTVSKDGWKRFREYLEIADEAAEQSWSAGIGLPLIAKQGITIAGAGHASSSMETWFKRGLSVCPDYGLLYSGYRNFLRPRWGGSYEALLAHAEDAAASGRFDTEIPWRAINALTTMVGDAVQAKRSPVIDPALADRAIAVVDGVTAGYLERNPDQLERYTCMRAAVRAHAGRRDNALAVIGELDRKAVRAYLAEETKENKVMRLDMTTLIGSGEEIEF